ncbi:MAG: glycosyltransferase [Clostridiales bacterium]|nr:glycosyltransferase [Clostridiales bacterium]
MKYCDDLMIAEKKLHHGVSLLYPGALHDKSSKVKILAKGKTVIDDVTIDSTYELDNALPVPLMDGVNDFSAFMVKKDVHVFDIFFDEHHFDVLHLHTFMGLPGEVLASARRHGIRIVYTSHDYFAICTRDLLFRNGHPCNDDHECHDCTSCNASALSFRKMQFLQSSLYKRLKDNVLIKILRQRHNRNIYNVNSVDTEENIIDADHDLCGLYQKLRRQNMNLLNHIDAVHFNSSVTFDVYRRYGKTKSNSHVITITNGSIQDHRKHVSVSSRLELGYLGPGDLHKGFLLLMEACDMLWKEGFHNFRLHLYLNGVADKPYAVNHGMYQYSDLEKVMSEFQLLVVPSLCYETFGMTMIEARSYGIPAIVSTHAGAKDLIIENVNGNTFIPESRVLQNLLEKIIKNPSIVEGYSQWICSNDCIKTMEQHTKEILDLYEQVGKNQK